MVGEVAVSAQRVLDVLVQRGVGFTVRYPPCEAARYEELTGIPAPTDVAELWSVLGGVDVAGMVVENADTAGRMCAARASEAEATGSGYPYEELDGSIDDAVRMVWWDRGWCPLVSGWDNAFAVDSHPGAKGHVGQVVFCDFDVYSDREAIWPSVTEFVLDLLAVVSAEALFFENGHGYLTLDTGSTATLMIAIREFGRARRDHRRPPIPSP